MNPHEFITMEIPDPETGKATVRWIGSVDAIWTLFQLMVTDGKWQELAHRLEIDPREEGK